jgi:hypothetical protein
VREDATATANNIAAHEPLFRLGIVSDLLSGIICIFLALAQTQKRKKDLKKHEIKFLTEANLTPRNVARFCNADRQRLADAPRVGSE